MNRRELLLSLAGGAATRTVTLNFPLYIKLMRF